MTQTINSPSGKYTLSVESIPTKPGCWNYTKGTVSQGDKVIAVVDRNYSAFPYLFVEDHPSGHDYLVCGADYQGQTVIELDTGKRRDLLPEEAAKGMGFCWIQYTYNKELNILLVLGCYWACPEEWRVYNFSNPLEGWPEIEATCELEASQRDPSIADGLITFPIERFNKTATELLPDDHEGPNVYDVVASRTFKIEDKKLVLVDEWVDPKERITRFISAIKQTNYDHYLEIYKKTDPIYLLAKEAKLSGRFGETKKNDWWMSIGICYPGWCPDFNEKDSRICIDLFKDTSVEFGRNKAPIGLFTYRGKERQVLWFPHSSEGMKEALNKADEIYREKTSGRD